MDYLQSVGTCCWVMFQQGGVAVYLVNSFLYHPFLLSSPLEVAHELKSAAMLKYFRLVNC